VRHLKEREQKFLDYLCENHPLPDTDPHREAKVLFDAIQRAFTRNHAQLGQQHVTIPWNLNQYLAACAYTALGYNVGGDIPWDRGDHDHIVLRLFQEFLRTLVHGFRTGLIVRDHEVIRDGDEVSRQPRILFGCLALPEWFETTFVPQES
jgi:hypothetical protein